MTGRDEDRGPVVPDLEVPAQRPSVSRAPAAPVVPQVRIDVNDADLLGDMEIDRGGSMSAPPASLSASLSPSSARPAPRASLPAGSGLELSAKPQAALRAPRTARGPSTLARIGAWLVTLVGFLGAFAALVKYVHRPGRAFVALLPHAFDATSAKQSGAFALTALALSIAVGYGGLRARGRSWAMLGSALMLLVAALAMVTVTLVATDETPSPPDGALLIPYVMPLALALFGIGVGGRGVRLFLDGGAGRVLALVVAMLGGALLFAGIELSGLAALLPRL